MNDGRELWAWVSEYPDGSVGMVGGVLIGVLHTPLCGRDESIVRQMEPYARAHGEATGQRVWLRKYKMVEDF